MDYTIEKFPKTRIATADVCSIGIRKHQVVAMIEINGAPMARFIRVLSRKIEKGLGL